MIGFLRKMFAGRRPDPDLRRLEVVHAARTAKVAATVEHAHEVANAIVRDESHMDEMRGSFARAGQRLSGR